MTMHKEEEEKEKRDQKYQQQNNTFISLLSYILNLYSFTNFFLHSLNTPPPIDKWESNI
jgi:hypothetical protein